MRLSSILPLASLLVLTGLGCAHAPRSATASAGAPSLADGDSPLHLRGVADPNAPYAELEHSPALVKRPEVVDIDAAVPCDGGQLSVFESGAQMNGAYRAVRLAFVNDGTEPCKLGGYPAISLVDQQGGPVGSIAVEKVTALELSVSLSRANPVQLARPSPEVLLGPRGSASFEVGWTSGPACPTVAGIVVSAPESTRLFRIAHVLSVCSGRIQITRLAGNVSQG